MSEVITMDSGELLQSSAIKLEDAVDVVEVDDDSDDDDSVEIIGEENKVIYLGSQKPNLPSEVIDLCCDDSEECDNSDTKFQSGVQSHHQNLSRVFIKNKNHSSGGTNQYFHQDGKYQEFCKNKSIINLGDYNLKLNLQFLHEEMTHFVVCNISYPPEFAIWSYNLLVSFVEQCYIDILLDQFTAFMSIRDCSFEKSTSADLLLGITKNGSACYLIDTQEHDEFANLIVYSKTRDCCTFVTVHNDTFKKKLKQYKCVHPSIHSLMSPQSKSRIPSAAIGTQEIPEDVFNDIDSLYNECGQSSSDALQRVFSAALSWQLQVASSSVSPGTTSDGVQHHSASQGSVRSSGTDCVKKEPVLSVESETDSGSGIPEISCPICLDTVSEVRSRNKKLYSTVCGHIFCEGCIMDAIAKKKECPTCRRRLTKKQFHPIFI